MTSIDQQFIEYIVKSLVGKPDAVKVDRRVDDLGVLLELTVDPEDLGRVIGKRGATAQSLRTLLRALGTKNEARYNLKIIDNGAPRPGRDDNSAATVSDDSTASQSDDQTVAAEEPLETPENDSWGSEDKSAESSAPADTEDDTVPLTHRAKFLMTLQSTISVVTIALVVTRAVTILS